ncbi:MAG: hypothetical protein Q4G14_00875 [Paracoccus sp. (in: a-proteobacteria)]|uniref:hypothetical protein n=1 Tax=Paracoccus sp. TaxID=267 RepID=UPI0026DFE5DA|nr:hypothetical protein [Paracoccus sp. (in: a-proteobacteria)]MDO5611780.1 hypothetical protein [Paracoccus sp. (in: a-proteobacteria)]
MAAVWKPAIWPRIWPDAMEFLFAILVIALAAGGLALGLVFGRRPVSTSCGSMDCVPGLRCTDCPNRTKDSPP